MDSPPAEASCRAEKAPCQDGRTANGTRLKGIRGTRVRAPQRPLRSTCQRWPEPWFREPQRGRAIRAHSFAARMLFQGGREPPYIFRVFPIARGNSVELFDVMPDQPPDGFASRAVEARRAKFIARLVAVAHFVEHEDFTFRLRALVPILAVENEKISRHEAERTFEHPIEERREIAVDHRHMHTAEDDAAALELGLVAQQEPGRWLTIAKHLKLLFTFDQFAIVQRRRGDVDLRFCSEHHTPPNSGSVSGAGASLRAVMLLWFWIAVATSTTFCRRGAGISAATM